jgi:hypothetical protein
MRQNIRSNAAQIRMATILPFEAARDGTEFGSLVDILLCDAELENNGMEQSRRVLGRKAIEPPRRQGWKDENWDLKLRI